MSVKFWKNRKPCKLSRFGGGNVKANSEDGLTNVFDRWAQQEKARCKFCLQGLSCQLCSQGPCRINEKTDMLQRCLRYRCRCHGYKEVLLQNAMGAAIYAHHAYQAFKTLKSTGEGKTPLLSVMWTS